MLRDFFISFGNFSSKAASANLAMQYVVPILAWAGLFRCAGDFFTKKYYRNGFINDRVWKKLVRIRK